LPNKPNAKRGEPLIYLARSFVLTFILALIVATAGFAMPEPSSGKSQALLEQAEPLYMRGNYKAALPLYEEAAKLALVEHIEDAERIRCARYLADCLCRLNQPDQALVFYQRIAGLIPATDLANRIENLSEQALCFGQKNEYTKAEELSRAAEKLCMAEPKSSDHLWHYARIKAQRGYFDYAQGKYPTAIKLFQEASDFCQESGRKDARSVLFREKMEFAQAGSYYHLKKFTDAYEKFKLTYDYDVRLFGKADLQTGWAMLALSDVLEKIKRPDEAQAWYRKAIWVFRKVNADRIAAEYIPNEMEPAKASDIRDRISKTVFGKSPNPTDMEDAQPPMVADINAMLNTHDPRSLYARPLPDAPGLVWMNPLIEQRGLVIAIHGLSLHHSSYEALARKLADAGYCTIAFDIRGFGTYQQALGAENLDFEGCMRDLHQVVGAIRADSPNKPLFLLGESMGGAIALQFAAQNPTLLDGLIAAVPASKRYQQTKATLKVAAHYLGNKNKPFDIGTDVIKQATKDPALKEAWGGDPTTRGTISAKELIAFQDMCNQNLENAKRITTTPVIIYQGDRDHLIKPDATYDLYRSIATKEKNLMMIGNAEHLIFEEGCFDQTTLKGLIAWMEAHSKTPSTAQ
jgi:alpha-beta hydrolase superfamily lysophospholipase